MGFISNQCALCGFARSPLIEVCYVPICTMAAIQWIMVYKLLYYVVIMGFAFETQHTHTHNFECRAAGQERERERTEKIYSYFALLLSFREPNEIRVVDFTTYGMPGVCVVSLCIRACIMSYDDFHWIIFMMPLCKYLSDGAVCESEHHRPGKTATTGQKMCRVEVVLFQAEARTTPNSMEKARFFTRFTHLAVAYGLRVSLKSRLMLFANERVIYYYVAWLTCASFESLIWLFYYREQHAFKI